MKSPRVFLRLVPLGLCAGAALFLWFDNLPGQRSEEAGSPQTMPGTATLRAAIDPETGALVTGPEADRLFAESPEKAVAAELEQMLNRSDVGLQSVYHADGRVSVDLEGRFMSTSVARLGPDGKPETLCTENQAEAEAFLLDAPEVDAHGREVK